MFQFFRRKDTAVRVFLGGLLVLVCITMVITLIPGLTGSSASDETVLAKVGSERVTSTELTRQLQQMTRNSRLPASMIPLYAPSILNQLVMQRATELEAHRLGLSISAQELAAQIRNNPQIFPNGQFIGNQNYEQMITMRFGMSVPEFEDEYKNALLTDKLQRLVTAGVVVTDEDVTREFHRRNDKVKVNYVVLKTSDVKDKIPVTDADLDAFYQKNRTRYQVPEQREFRYVALDTGKLRDTVQVSDKDLQDFYKQNQDRFRVEDRVKVSHILFKTVGKTPQETEEIHKKAEDVLKKLQGGADFAQTAKQYSDDAATTPKGGELGWIVRGQTVPEFEKTAFSLDPGKLSGVIKTQYGFHILKVEERQRAHQQTLDEVRDQILPQVKAAKAQSEADKEAQKAEDAFRKSKGNLEAAAAAIGSKVEDSGMIKISQPLPGVPGSAQLNEALFAPNLKPNAVTDPINSGNTVVIAQLVKAVPAHPAELAEVRSQVENDYRNEKAVSDVASKMKQLAEDAKKNGNDLAKAAAAEHLTVQTSEPFTADGTIKDVGSASSLPDVFRLPVGSVGGPASVTDGQVVYKVAERQVAPDADLAAQRDGIRQALADEKSQSMFRVFMDSLRDRLEKEGKLKVNEAAVQRIAQSFQ